MAYGMPHATATNPVENRYKYSGKELTTALGINAYDFAARLHSPAFPRFLQPDPYAESYTQLSPYTFCASNPINFTDPSGKAIFIDASTKIGDDGNDDNKVYAIKSVIPKKLQRLESENNTIYSGISKAEQERTIKFIKNTNSNERQSIYAENQWVYDNCIEIEASLENRQRMVDIVSQDTGKNPRSDNCNREYGGYINEEGSVIAVPPGPVTNPENNSSASILNYTGLFSTFHSHPSGDTFPNNHNSFYGEIIQGDVRSGSSYKQYPSVVDILGAGSYTHYVFGMRSKKVYIYNINGIQAEMKIKDFKKKW